MPSDIPHEVDGFSIFTLISLDDSARSRRISAPSSETDIPAQLGELALHLFSKYPSASPSFKQITDTACELAKNFVREHQGDPVSYRKRMHQKEGKETLDLALLQCLQKLKEHADDQIYQVPCDPITESPQFEKDLLNKHNDILQFLQKEFEIAFGYVQSKDGPVRAIILGDKNTINDAFNVTSRTNIDSYNVSTIIPPPPPPPSRRPPPRRSSPLVSPPPYSAPSLPTPTPHLTSLSSEKDLHTTQHTSTTSPTSMSSHCPAPPSALVHPEPRSPSPKPVISPELTGKTHARDLRDACRSLTARIFRVPCVAVLFLKKSAAHYSSHSSFAK